MDIKDKISQAQANQILREEAQLMGITFSPIMQQNININPQIANGFINNMLNKLVLQEGSDPQEGINSNPLLRFTGDYPLPVADVIELYTQDILPPEDYDGGQWVPANGQDWISNNLIAFSNTEFKKRNPQTYNLQEISRAFTSAGNMSAWLARYTRTRDRGYALFEYNLIQQYILPNVITSFYIDATKKEDGYTEFQSGLIKMRELLEQSEGLPTWAFNADGRGRLFNYINMSDFILMVGPKTKGDLIVKALSNLFNKEYMDVNNTFSAKNVLKIAGIKANEFYVIHKYFFTLMYRIRLSATQFFALNYKYIVNDIRWYNPKMFPWMTAFKFNFELSDDKDIVIGGYNIITNAENNPTSITFNVNNKAGTEYNLKKGDYIEVRVATDSNKTTFGVNYGKGNDSPGGVFKYQEFINENGNQDSGTHKYLNDNPQITTTYSQLKVIPKGSSNIKTIDISGLNLDDGNYIAQMFGYMQGVKFTSSAIQFTIKSSRMIDVKAPKQLISLGQDVSVKNVITEAQDSKRWTSTRTKIAKILET